MIPIPVITDYDDVLLCRPLVTEQKTATPRTCVIVRRDKGCFYDSVAECDSTGVCGYETRIQVVIEVTVNRAELDTSSC